MVVRFMSCDFGFGKMAGEDYSSHFDEGLYQGGSFGMSTGARLCILVNRRIKITVVLS